MADVEAKTDSGLTALHGAAMAETRRWCQLLLEDYKDRHRG